MVKSAKWLAAGVLCAAAAAAQAQIDQVRVWAAACASCHGTEGRAQPGMASLAGMNKDVMLQTMLDFQSDRRAATVMHQIAKGYSAEQLAQIAGYFAAQKK